MEQPMYTCDQLIDLCNDVISMFEGSNDKAIGLSDVEKKEIAESAAGVILSTTTDKLKVLLKYLKNN